MESVLRKIKALRKENKRSVEEIAKYLHIDEKVYLQFERGKSKKETSYYIVLKLADFYGVSVDYLLSSYSWRRGEFELFRSDLPDFSVLSDEQKKMFAVKAEEFDVIDLETFESVSRKKTVKRWIYEDVNGKKKSAVLVTDAPSESDQCLVMIDGEVQVLKMMICDEKEYFESDGKKYFIDDGNVEILCKIFARIEE